MRISETIDGVKYDEGDKVKKEQGKRSEVKMLMKDEACVNAELLGLAIYVL